MNRVTGYVQSEADRIAIEHVVWAAAEGITPREILLSVDVSWPEDKEPSWHDAVLAIAIAWRKLPRRAGFLRVAA